MSWTVRLLWLLLPVVVSRKYVVQKKEPDLNYQIEEMGALLGKLGDRVSGLKRQSDSYSAAFGRIKIIQDEGFPPLNGVIETVNDNIGLFDPQLDTAWQSLGSLNASMLEEEEIMDDLEVYLKREFTDLEGQLPDYSDMLDEYLQEIDDGIDDQKQEHSELLLEEANQQAEYRDAFRRELADFQKAREIRATETAALIQTVNTQVAAVGADTGLDDRVAALKARVQSLMQDVAGLTERLSAQQSALGTHELTLEEKGEQLTGVGDTFETHLQQHGQLQQIMETLQASVAALQTSSGEIQTQATAINEQIIDQDSRLDNSEQEQQTLRQQMEALGRSYEQQNIAEGLRLNPLEASLATAAADTMMDDAATQLDSAVQTLQGDGTELNSKVEQNQNLLDSIQEDQDSQQQTIQSKTADVQAYVQLQETLRQQLAASQATHEEEVSAEDERLQAIQTQVESSASSSAEDVTALQTAIDGLSTGVLSAQRRFALYTDPSVILADLTRQDQSIQDLEESQNAHSTLQQQLQDFVSSTDERIDAVESDMGETEGTLQQLQSDAAAVSQTLSSAVGLTESVTNLETQVSANTRALATLSSSVEHVDVNLRQNIQTQLTSLQQRIDAIPASSTQQAVSAALAGDTAAMDTTLDGMDTAVDNLETTALDLATDAEEAFEMTQADVASIVTELTNQQRALDALESSDTSGLQESVAALQTSLTQTTSSVNTASSSLSELEQAVRELGSGGYFDHYESGSLDLTEQSDWWGLSSYTGDQIRDVSFDQRFRSTPVVFATISKFDMNKNRVFRLKVVVESVTTTGFRLVFGPWVDTELYSGRANYIALGRKA